jgi:hypothetical protein
MENLFGEPQPRLAARLFVLIQRDEQVQCIFLSRPIGSQRTGEELLEQVAGDARGRRRAQQQVDRQGSTQLGWKSATNAQEHDNSPVSVMDSDIHGIKQVCVQSARVPSN